MFGNECVCVKRLEVVGEVFMQGVPALTRPGSADLYFSLGSESGFNVTSINHKLQLKAHHQEFKIRPPVLRANLTCPGSAQSPHYNRNL
jgi:hypothetical protein